jgi:peptidoglycan/xylan/chitin deacetylase (PgdA/CDA1 family)
VGNNIEKNPSLAQEIIGEGHTIGNHTYNHKQIHKLSKTERLDEINKCSEIIKDKLTYEVKYFRPPHGRFNFNLSNELGEMNLQNIMWSMLTYDYKNKFSTVKKSAQYLEKNSIIVLHDNKKSQPIIIDSIKYLVDEIHKRNFKIGTPEECLK